MSYVPAEDPAILAQRLFDASREQPRPGGGDRGSSPSADAEARHAPAAPDARSLTEGELRDVLVAARAAIERTAEAVRALRARATTTTADLRALGEAIENALAATNDRLTSLEQHVLGEAGPDALAAEDAMRRLRRTVRGSEGSPES